MIQFRRHVYVERQCKSKSSAYSNRSDDTACFISLTYIKKAKGQELTLDAHHTKFSKCLNTYFQCLLKMPDQSNMNETNR